MKKLSKVLLLVLTLFALSIFVIGCGGSAIPTTRLGNVEKLSVPDSFVPGEIEAHTSVQPAITKGVEPRGQTGTITRFRESNTNFLNPNFPAGYLTPTIYKVSVAKVELLKGVNDPNPYVVFDKTNLSEANIFDLSSPSSIDSLAGNTNYPSAGTYTHVRMKMVYIELGVNADLFGDGMKNNLMRLYCSSVTPILNGDVLLYENSTWNWINDNLENESGNDVLLPLAGGRPDNNTGWIFTGHGYPEKLSTVIQDYFFSMSTSAVPESTDPYIHTFELPTPVVFPSNPSGVYIIAFKFDKSNTFVFNDVDNNGLYEPCGGDDVTNEALGEPIWYIDAPQIDVAIIKYTK